MARDITEGRDTRAIAVDIGVVSTASVWQNTDVAYDVAIGGMPFIYAINDQRPYVRQTAPFRKDQFDNGSEPGEQSLVGWWIRSQSSFHRGAGIKFYDTTGGEVIANRFFESRGVDVWTKGQVTLLKNCTLSSHPTTATLQSNGRPHQALRSIKWNTTNGALLLDGYDVDKIAEDGTATHFIDYNAGAGVYPVYSICDDGSKAYWVTNATSGGTTKLTMYSKPLTGSSASTADEVKMFDDTAVISNSIMEFTKERIVACFDNKVYEIPTSATALPSPLYTHPASSFVYTSIASSGPAIYIAGYNGIQSSIIKFTLSTAGVMPTLNSAVVAAELPVGEIVHKIHYYLGYMMIGTNKGVRAAIVNDQDGAITYGPLIVETSQPCYDFASRDRFVWCATGVEGTPGVIRIDLGTEIESLRFAWANDLEYTGVSGFSTTACAFAAGATRLMFCTNKVSSTNGAIYIEDASTLKSEGYLTTGAIRFGTLEAKNFKRLVGRGDFTYGAMTLETVDKNGVQYDHITYNGEIEPVEVTTSSPASAQEYISYKFVLSRDTTTTTLGPTFKGYQAKATIATPRQRMIKFPVYCFDVETDKYNVQIGYEGRALDRIRALEDIEQSGDVLTWQDLSNNESRQAVIEQITFTRMTPPDKKFDGYGGIVEIIIRTV